MNRVMTDIHKRPAGLANYLALARFDHATKHVFILPGIGLAWTLRGIQTPSIAYSLAVGLIAAICIASANYVINEYLDREFDQHHPTKSARNAVQTVMNWRVIVALWVAFLTVGLAAAALGGLAMFLIAAAFAAQGIVYNVRPLRTKEVAYLDVLSEAVNNSFRLMIGWVIVDPNTLPPASIILAFWFGGAFLMAAKRMSEYREIVASHGKDLLVRYRKSFANYTESGLTASTVCYALLSVAFTVVFLVKYRIEYLLCVPFIVALFTQYLALAMRPASTAQAPENLFRERRLLAVAAALAITFAVMTFVDLPMLDTLASQSYIELS